jgi:hypothetical protein
MGNGTIAGDRQIGSTEKMASANLNGVHNRENGGNVDRTIIG